MSDVQFELKNETKKVKQKYKIKKLSLTLNNICCDPLGKKIRRKTDP